MDALAALRLQVEWGADEALLDAPVDRTAAAAPSAVPPARALSPRAVPAARPASPAGTPAARARLAAEAANSVDALRAALAAFDGCSLRDTASALVFADGDPAAGLVLVGDAPDADDDRAGRPFAGAAGALLDRMLGSIGLDRGRVLLTAVVPWRPPGNRPPTEAEVQACLPFLHRHLALLRPRRLLLLGGLATRALVPGGVPVRRLRGAWTPVAVPGLAQPLPALPTHAPAALQQKPLLKREAWADLLVLRRALDEDAG